MERTFGVLKRRFPILNTQPEYSIAVQSKIFPALCALHNFLRTYNDTEIENNLEETIRNEFQDRQRTWPSASSMNDTLAVGEKETTETIDVNLTNESLRRHESDRRRHARCEAIRDQLADRMWSEAKTSEMRGGKGSGSILYNLVYPCD